MFTKKSLFPIKTLTFVLEGIPEGKVRDNAPKTNLPLSLSV